jgi:SAM-dependent methyltransferase
MAVTMTAGIRPHNRKAAAIWGSGGRDYDAISATIADAIEHVVLRLAPRPGERFLDVATGTGLAARRVAERGASVVGIDIGARLIAAARALAPEVQFEIGDAESLPFADRSFDAVVSTFGVMFTSRPQDAARELARVCRQGGRLGLATWLPGDTIEGVFTMTRPYVTRPVDPPPSPFAWGRRERVQELLGEAFDLKFETGVTTLRRPSGKAVWDIFVAGDGPTKSLAASLDAERRRQLQADFAAFHDAHRNEIGVAMPREYLVAIGVRRAD